jgi:L-ascorbate metabolism protein UlaG (beta-lactamase superfamily)
MNITKLGHCCLLIEVNDLVIMTDPGNFSELQNDVKGVDLILITHEHADHLHIESLKKVLANNPAAKVITNSAVGKILDKENISYSIVEDGQGTLFQNIKIEGFGTAHEVIHSSIPNIMNTGYMIAEKLFYPGDAFYAPHKSVDVLALPVAGPWCKISDAVDYALRVKPRIAFPVHDGMLKIFGGHHKVPEKILSEKNISFVVLETGKKTSF